jgi:predicted amidohydrolase YtcJ
MTGIDRRDFVRASVGAVVTATGGVGLESALHRGRGEEPQQGLADLVVINGNVLTADAAAPRAEAFAVAAGRILMVGRTDAVRRLAGQGTTIVDARGRTVTPGFIDPHMHPRPMFAADSPYEPVDLSPAAAPTLSALIVALRRKADKTPPGMWVIGRGYNDALFGRHPTRVDLDSASADHPIRITHASGHISVVNSRVLAGAGITAATADPAGGALDRDSSGAPTGVVRESAGRLAMQGNPPIQQPSVDEQRAGLARCLRAFARTGLTSIGVAGSGPEQFALFQTVTDAPMRVNFMFLESHFPAVRDLGVRLGLGDERLRVVSIKMFHGNSLSGRTCWLSQPYSDRADYYGIPPARSQAELDAAVLAIHGAGFQIAVHSNGDREIDMVLTAMERAQAAVPRPDVRHRIEHCSVTTPAILDRIVRAGVVPVFHSYMYEHGSELASYGTARLDHIHPFRTALDLGIHCALSFGLAREQLRAAPPDAGSRHASRN